MPADIDSQCELDARTAAARAMTFRVCRKERQAGPWTTVFENVSDLADAVARAKELDAFEAGVITAGPGRLAGFIYWTSRAPDVFNSTVITHDVI